MTTPLSPLHSVIKSRSTQERVMQMLLYLMEQKNSVGRPTLEKALGVNARTIFRYLNIIEDAWNIPLIKDNGRYGIKRTTNAGQMTFTSEEVETMYLAMLDLPEGAVKGSVREKLLQIYAERKQAEKLVDAEVMDRIAWFEKQVNQAKQKFQVRLMQYVSPSGASVRDRIVSPVYFNSVNLELYAYDMETNSTSGPVLKVFKVERMGGQERMKERIPKSLDKEHDLTRDPFGYLVKGQPLLSVCIQMDLLAFKLFELHFPQLITQVVLLSTESNYKYEIKLEVVRPDPLVGFCLGVLNHLEIVDSPAFLLALKSFYERNIEVNLGKLGLKSTEEKS